MAALEETGYPGKRFGLPERGIGAAAATGTRMLAFLLDLALSFFVAWLFTRPELPQNWSLAVWAGMTVLAVGAFGFTPGQFVFGIRVLPLRGRLVGIWAVPRTVLTFLIVPALLMDRDGRGWHDRLCRTVVVRMR